MRKIISILILILSTTLWIHSNENIISLSKDVNIEEIADNIFIHHSKINLPPWGDVWANGLIIINKKIMLIDTPWNDEQTHVIYQWLEKKTGKIPDYLVITHFHEDNQGGMPYSLKQGTACYSSELTRDIAKEKKLPVAGHYFKESFKFDLGEISVTASFQGGGHTKDNIVLWIPDKKILYGGCLIRELKAMGLGNTADADLAAWPRTITKLIKTYPDDILVIPGHGTYGGKELLKHTLMLATPQVHQ